MIHLLGIFACGILCLFSLHDDPQSMHGEGRHPRPLDLACDPALNRAQHGIGGRIFLLANIGKRAVDQLHQQMLVIGVGLQGFGRVPPQALGRSGMVVTIRTAEALGAQADGDRRAEDREMAQLDGLVKAMKVAWSTTMFCAPFWLSCLVWISRPNAS